MAKRHENVIIMAQAFQEGRNFGMAEIEAVNQVTGDASWIWEQLRLLCETDSEHRMVTLHSPQAGFARSRGRFYEIVCGVAAWLRFVGVRPGDSVAVDASLRSETLMVWLACLHVGAIAVFFPPDMRHSDCASEAARRMTRVVIVEQPEHVGDWLKMRRVDGTLCQHIVYMDVRGSDGRMIDRLLGWPLPDGVIGFDACIESQERKTAAAFAYGTDAPCAVVFSQGTTRGERAVELTQAMLKIQASDLVERLKIVAQDNILFVPQTVSAPVLSVLAACLMSGASLALARNFILAPLVIMEQVQPNLIFMLPGDLHALAHIMLTASARTRLHSNWNRFCMRAGKFRSRHTQGYLQFTNQLIDSLCLRHLKNRLGAFCRAMVSFGANLDAHDAEFFAYLDVPVFNGYTVTEAAGFVHLHAFDGGGGFLSSCKIRISKGILSLCPAGQQTYFSTGDCVFEDSRTGLCVRRIERVTLSDGQRVDTLALRDILVRERLIEEVLIYGEGRPYLTALIYLDASALKAWARERKLASPDDFGALYQNPKVYKYVKACVDACNANRTGCEEIRKIALLPVPLSEEPRALTYAGLFRQYEVEQKYAGILQSFYEDNF